MTIHFEPAPGYMFIYRWWITTRDGKRVYPKHGRPFRLEVPID